MKKLRAIAVLEDKEYNSNQQFEGNPAWNIRNVERIEWENEEERVVISFTKGTLLRYLSSPDGIFIILIFRNNVNYLEPCNCVVLNQEGKVHQVICAPTLISPEVKKYHKGEGKILGHIYGATIKNISGKEEITLFIEDIKEYFSTGVRYCEQRIFYPETGEMGSLVSVQIPLR